MINVTFVGIFLILYFYNGIIPGTFVQRNVCVVRSNKGVFEKFYNPFVKLNRINSIYRIIFESQISYSKKYLQYMYLNY